MIKYVYLFNKFSEFFKKLTIFRSILTQIRTNNIKITLNYVSFDFTLALVWQKYEKKLRIQENHESESRIVLVATLNPRYPAQPIPDNPRL